MSKSSNRSIKIRGKSIRVSLLLVFGAFILGFGFVVHSNLNAKKISHDIIKPVISTPNTTVKPPQTIPQEDKFSSFSYAYNKTHLWSLRLADENHYRAVQAIPCRSIRYLSGPITINETMDTCNQTVKDEFSIESTLRAQQWIYEHQHPMDCTNKKFAIIQAYAWSGFGSTIHQVLWAFGVALGEDRIAVYRKPGNWIYGNCESSNLDCFFLPITNCTVPAVVDGNQAIVIKADFGHWINPKYPSVFKNQSFNWIRSQLLFYLMRYNPSTLAYAQKTVAKYFQPPSIDLHRPYIAVYVRRSDKIVGGEMKQAYSLKHYFDLFNKDAHMAKIQTVYLNSEDPNVFTEFDQINKQIGNYYKILRIDVTRDMYFSKLLSIPMESRGKIILEFLTDLYIEVNGDLHVGTLSSNWCRLVDEIRLALGKIAPFYTPENIYWMNM